ncbi:MAG: SH3 domain-containing protein, partial [Spirochaetes bacterium]|nr:SH3 domain-containing protein [Spirochaetota bacterium]
QNEGGFFEGVLNLEGSIYEINYAVSGGVIDKDGLRTLSFDIGIGRYLLSQFLDEGQTDFLGNPLERFTITPPEEGAQPIDCEGGYRDALSKFPAITDENYRFTKTGVHELSTGLNLRQGPSTSFDVVRVGRKGELLRVLGHEINETGTSWARAKTPEGNTVYAASRFLTPLPEKLERSSTVGGFCSGKWSDGQHFKNEVCAKNYRSSEDAEGLWQNEVEWLDGNGSPGEFVFPDGRRITFLDGYDWYWLNEEPAELIRDTGCYKGNMEICFREQRLPDRRQFWRDAASAVPETEAPQPTTPIDLSEEVDSVSTALNGRYAAEGHCNDPYTDTTITISENSVEFHETSCDIISNEVDEANQAKSIMQLSCLAGC